MAIGKQSTVNSQQSTGYRDRRSEVGDQEGANQYSPLRGSGAPFRQAQGGLLQSLGSQISVVALAGGVGGAKLAHGLAQHLAPDQLTIVVNTGDDFEHLGLLICPDIDTVLYNLAELQHPQQGWGRMDESFQVLEETKRLGHDAWFRLGDRDIALHLIRRQMLDAGLSLTETIAELARRLGIVHPVLPMSNQPVRTIIRTPEGELPFQEYFVHRRTEPKMLGMRLEGLAQAQPSAAVSTALAEADLIVFCPSNPYVSIDPILALPGVREAIRATPTIAVSPIIGGAALKGPAAKMMAELGADVSATGVAHHYADLLDGFVLDQADQHLAEQVSDMSIQPLVTDTIMRDKMDRERLAGEVLNFELKNVTCVTSSLENKYDEPGSLAVIVPMKPLALAKGRLRPALRDTERRTLAHDMLTHVLATVSTSKIADLAVLISADKEVLELAHDWDFVPLQEIESGYNESTTQAIDWIQTEGINTVLILPADLPNLQSDDLINLVSLIRDESQVAIIAPDATETGTNALLIRPPDLIRPSFGPDSFSRHCALARSTGVEPTIYRSPTLACDIDLPADLNQLSTTLIS